MDFDETWILSLEAPWAYLLSGTDSDVTALAQNAEAIPGTVTRTIRGQHCSTKHALLQEWAIALAFPDYFGGNWDAFDECITDLRWLPAQQYVIIISHAEYVLPKDERAFEIFVSILGESAEEWATAREDARAHSSVPFRIIFHTTPPQRDRIARRLTHAGADAHPFTHL